ncbi:MAG: flagellar hook protein FlgE [Desulfovibrionales bacterium]
MGLMSGMYSGVSGLLTHGEAISVIGNNIANVSTIGYKGSRVDFEDSLSQEIATGQGPGQVGRGVNIGAVMKNFQQGAFETTTETTDLAIGGQGFFMVKPKGEEVNYYTRAGNFRFDQDGYMVDPHGYVVQGWQINNDSNSSGIATVGVPTDIRLENFQSPPQGTGTVNMIANLDSSALDNSDPDDDHPMFSMFQQWDGTAETPLGASRYAYQSTIKVYDDNGEAHDLTVYFDPVDAATVNDSSGDRHWEYMVTVNPNEDGRAIMNDPNNPRVKKGVLMMGSLSFNAGGDLQNMSAFTWKSGSPDELSNWEAADFSENGLPVCTANFLGVDGMDTTSPTEASKLEIDFGVSSRSGSWEDGDITAADVEDDISAVDLGMKNFQLSALTSTSYSTSESTTLSQSQDGYAAGFLQSISANRDGVLTGRYSNGQVIQHFALTLANFNNQWGLNREGGNLFSETRSSGPPLTGLAGTGGRGTVASNSLEQSNVDLATEFVKMISVERGFQSNSKVIRTTDTMLAEIIQLKR